MFINLNKERLKNYQDVKNDEEARLLNGDKYDEQTCIICCSNKRDAAFVDCGHNVLTISI